jgi:hypothetical protein
MTAIDIDTKRCDIFASRDDEKGLDEYKWHESFDKLLLVLTNYQKSRVCVCGPLQKRFAGKK